VSLWEKATTWTTVQECSLQHSRLYLDVQKKVLP
jgi:hypothetical protein